MTPGGPQQAVLRETGAPPTHCPRVGTVEPRHRKVITMDGCRGTAVVVTTAEHPDVTIDGAACVAAVLYVQKDHSAYLSQMYG